MPFAGDTHVLQNPKNVARDWFMAIATAHSERVRNGQTAQGFWVIGSDGTFYGYNNNRNLQRVNQMLDQARARFRENPPKDQAPTAEELAAPAAPRPPAGASIVRVHARIRPIPDGCADSNRRVSRDHLWIGVDEVATLRKGQVPDTLLGRIARFHLVDNIRGEPDMWNVGEVRRLEVSKVTVEGDTIRFEGLFALGSADGKRGYEGRLEVEARTDDTNRIVRFRGFASGQAWGAGTWTPGAPDGKFGLVIAMVDADDGIAKVVPPQGINWGREYWNPGVAARR